MLGKTGSVCCSVQEQWGNRGKKIYTNCCYFSMQEETAQRRAWESFWSRCGLVQGLSGEVQTKPAREEHGNLSSPQPVVSASSAVKEVRTGKVKCMLFKTCNVCCLLTCYGCTRRQSFPRIFAEIVQNLFPPHPSLSWNFNFGQKGIFC